MTDAADIKNLRARTLQENKERDGKVRDIKLKKSKMLPLSKFFHVILVFPQRYSRPSTMLFQLFHVILVFPQRYPSLSTTLFQTFHKIIKVIPQHYSRLSTMLP